MLECRGMNGVAEMQSFKRVGNYFTDSLLYREVNEVPKKLLPDDVNSDNEADSEFEEDTLTTFVLKPIVAYLNDPECNNPAVEKGEWVINEDVAFDYSVSLDGVFNSADSSSLHVPLPTSND